MRLLILGGAGLAGPHQIRYALERGHRVTVFNRGQRRRAWPAGVEWLGDDRETGDYESLRGRRFDVCIDNPSSVPHWVRDAADVLQGQIEHFICISTVSVYASDAEPDADESAARHVYTGPDAMAETLPGLRHNLALYGPLKAATEDEAMARFAGRCTVIRPGLIVGPGDETDRFSYWPLRVQRGGRVLTPPLLDPVKFIDARDLAEWTVRIAEQRLLGVFNAIGPAHELTMGALLNQLREATQSEAEWVEAPLAFLEAEGVAPWRDLPLWLPGSGETAGMHRRSVARALAAGLSFRSVADTCAGLLEWWQAQDAARRESPLRAGLTPEREAALLSKLG